jgi:hypothetical protein
MNKDDLVAKCLEHLMSEKDTTDRLTNDEVKKVRELIKHIEFSPVSEEIEAIEL